MSTGKVEMICGGTCSGKTALALGRALQAAARKKNVIIIEFLKGSQKFDNTEILSVWSRKSRFSASRNRTAILNI